MYSDHSPKITSNKDIFGNGLENPSNKTDLCIKQLVIFNSLFFSYKLNRI
jgi:hypothetical protein